MDDFSVLMAQMKQTGIPDLLEVHFPIHGNWQGLSLGWVASGWLGHILSVGDHRQKHMQGWVEMNPLTMYRSVGQAVTGLDFSDDRLPMFLKDDRRVTGLIRLLSIGLRVLTLLEFVVRRGLTQNQEQLAGL